jgi:hypothetical protein
LIGYIPNFYNDELLPGFLARLKNHSLLDLTTLSRILFGKSSGNYNPLFPRRLDQISSRFEAFGINSGTLLNDHTILPLYKGFYSHEEYNEFETFFKRNGSQAKVLPQTSKYLSLSSFKYHPLCCEEDKQKSGEPFLRRSHNIPQIEICNEHNVFLSEFKFQLLGNSYHRIFDVNNIFKPVPILTFNRSQLIFDLSQDLVEKLNNGCIPSLSTLRDTAIRKGFCFLKKTNLSINRRLYDDLLTYTSRHRNSLFNILAGNHFKMLEMLRGIWSSNIPVHYFLIKRYIEALPDKKEETLELKCINKFCSRFNLTIPSSFRYFNDKKNHGFVGECPECGLEYEFSRSRLERKTQISIEINVIFSQIHYLTRATTSLIK